MGHAKKKGGSASEILDHPLEGLWAGLEEGGEIDATRLGDTAEDAEGGGARCDRKLSNVGHRTCQANVEDL